MTFVLITAGMLGAVVGSFLNVVIYRLPRQCKSITRPARSFCPHCRAAIAWYDNVPIGSWIALGAKCRRCGGPISVRYTIVEALTAAAFVCVAWRFLGMNEIVPVQEWRWGLVAAYLWLISALIAASFIDLELSIIPDEITLSGFVIGPALAVAFPDLFNSFAGYFPYGDIISSPRMVSLLGSLLGMLAGGGVIWLTRLLGSIAFRKEAMGLGDVKFMAMIGSIIGWEGVLLALLIACLIGSISGIVIKIIRGTSYVPFGPYLSAGAVLTIFFHDPLIKFIIHDYPGLF